MSRPSEIDVIERLWPELPEHIRQAILVLIRA